MRIAYIISAYKLPEQLVRLVKKLQAPDTAFFIHVDRKTVPEMFGRMAGPLRGLGNVFFLKRHLCHYCDFGHVRATLKGMEDARIRRFPFDYMILLTGQDYPVKSNGRIRKTLEESGGRSYMVHFRLPSGNWSGNGGMDRITDWHFHWRGKHFRLPLRRKLPCGLLPFGGDSYWCLSRECAEYVSAFVQRHGEVVRFFKHAWIPDELFFQTILANSPLRDGLVNDDLRYIDWSQPGGPYPAILKKDDFARLSGTGDLFARKFDMTVDADVLDLIDGQCA